jgi:hypothetical protein
MRELTYFVHDLLDEHGIVHWLDSGSLLGAVRHGELIPWDDDIDFGILERDAERVRALAPEIRAAGHYLVPTGQLAVLYSPINWNRLDFTVWRERDGKLTLEDEWDARLSFPGMPPERYAFPASYVETLEQVPFYDRTMPAPSPVDRLLAEHRYGEDYLTPRPYFAALDPRVYPGAEDAPPEVLARLTETHSRLAERVTRSRLFRRPHGRDWILAGLPVEEAEGIADSLALVDRALAEFGSLDGRARRGARRLRWLATRRPEPLGLEILGVPTFFQRWHALWGW